MPHSPVFITNLHRTYDLSPAGATVRAATSTEVKKLRREARDLREVFAE